METIKNAHTQSAVALYRALDQEQARVKTLEDYLFGSPELWCVTLQVAGQVLAMRSKAVAERYASEITEVSGGAEVATVVPSPWPLDVHTEKAFEVIEGWLAGAERTLTAQQIQIGRLRMHLASAKAAKSA